MLNGASNNMEIQLFNVVFAQIVTSLHQVALRLVFGSRNTAKMETIHADGVMVNFKSQMSTRQRIVKY